jgi:hypothetical protein
MAFAARQPRRSAAPTARASAAAGSLMLTLARLVRVVALVVVALIVAAILLRVLGANQANTIVRDIHDAARWLVGPFHNLFSLKDPKLSIAVNWGVAALVYFVVGNFIARLIARAAR